jgi:nitronate monooxygenase
MTGLIVERTAGRVEDYLWSLPLPLICAPMTGISTPELATAACAAGVIGSFPTSNAPSAEALDEWFDQVAEEVEASTDPHVARAPLLANLIVHPKRNPRLESDLASILRHDVPLVITSVGSPAAVIPALHDGGVLVLADVASIRHAERAIEAGADALVVLSAGAGGHTGWANPMAFARAIRKFYDGPLVVTGGIADGAALWAALTLGCDAGMMGTRFIATDESGAPGEWKESIVSSSMDDVQLTSAMGIAASLLRDGNGSAGHTVSCVDKQVPAAVVIEEVRAEFEAARKHTHDLLERWSVS